VPPPLKIYDHRADDEVGAAATAAAVPGTATLYGGATPAVDLAAAARKLLSQLDASKAVFHANVTLWTSPHSSFHLFATNRTEPCHYHPGTTLAHTLQGQGAFRVPYAAPILQSDGDTFFIPARKPHAFGPAHVGAGPVLVTVLWTPPYHPKYTIPTTGCRM
jgi:hypothetical protein